MTRLEGKGWLRDRPDPRDIRLGLDQSPAFVSSVDLRNEHMPPPYAQLHASSCVGNAVAGMASYVHSFEGQGTFNASRLFIYYQARLLEGAQAMDCGAQVRDAMRACATVGMCSEETDPYDVSQVCTAPSDAMMAEAAQHRISRYMRLPQSIRSIKAVLMSGYPVAFGFTCFESFEGDEVAASGVLPMPQPNEQDIGGHAVVCCGYDEPAQQVIIRNSWGTTWGKGGYFLMPYAYFLNPNLCSDFWTIRLET